MFRLRSTSLWLLPKLTDHTFAKAQEKIEHDA